MRKEGKGREKIGGKKIIRTREELKIREDIEETGLSLTFLFTIFLCFFFVSS